MIIVSPFICRLLSIVIDVGAITLFPFIICAHEPDPVTVNHESIHLRQQMELLVLGFYAVYVWDWLWLQKKIGKDGSEAYELIRFEQEAYAHEAEPGYLASRKLMAWRKFSLRPSA